MEDSLAQALEALKSFDWGMDFGPLKPIDDAVVATHGDAAARAELEKQLVAVLSSGVSRAAKDAICRKLKAIGTAASVPTLAAMLRSEEDAHMARFALERIEAPEAGAALREAVPTLSGSLKIGAMSSLGARGEAASVDVLSAALADSDPAVVRSAALALGAIGSADAAKALAGCDVSDAGVKIAVTDASFSCADALLAADKRLDAMAIYRRFNGEDQPRHVRLAATRGILACAGR